MNHLATLIKSLQATFTSANNIKTSPTLVTVSHITMLMLVMMAVVPGVLVYTVSMLFAVKSIDSWFDVRVEAALEGGLDLGRSVLDAMQADLLAAARERLKANTVLANSIQEVESILREVTGDRHVAVG